MATLLATLASLVESKTKEQALAFVDAGFTGLGFKVTSWVDGGVGQTLRNFLADFICQSHAVTAEIAKGALLRTAQGGWLRARALSDYNETPGEASRTVGMMVLTSSASAPPYTISPRQVWVTNGAGLRFNNTTGGTLASGAGLTLRLTFEAEFAGSAYNLPTGSVLSLVTALPGVTVANPAYSGGDWITTDGVDEASPEQIVAACVAKWATRSYQTPAAAYEYWVTQASPLATRALVVDDNPDGPGTFRVYIAGPSGQISDGSVVGIVDAYLQARRGITSLLTVYASAVQTVTIAGTIYVRGFPLAAVQGAVEAAVAELFASIPIGGVVIGEAPGAVMLDAIIEAIRGVDGVVRFAWTAPTADVAVTSTRVAVPSISGLAYQVA